MPRVPIPTGFIDVGELIQVTADEAKTIRAHALAMERATVKMKPGWLKETVMHHNAMSRVIWRMVERAHSPS